MRIVLSPSIPTSRLDMNALKLTSNEGVDFDGPMFVMAVSP